MRKLGRFIGVVALLTAAFTLGACGSDDDSGSAAGSSAKPAASASAGVGAPTKTHGRECTADDIKVTGGFGANPQIKLPDNCDPPKQLVSKDLVAGSGPGAAAGQQLTMNYSLVTWSDGKKLDSSFDRGKPFPLTLGAGQVIPGWEQGLDGVQQGTRRLLIIPPELGYGKGGNGIKPNETLVFVTDTVAIGN
ncbi:FKBP-type peptidyl-prolyl cis-trans isomerase [Nocardia bovistercoris]|uniref:Peptidyl-prolyl cis-trans isomerase n=1 Tax=Nocardia bovistercoris TaxID=2785916 RepID=A0A931N0C4_9NOCA|nr:FKBP-type peptidyl-prolyl cis-trans isomerase [Nocardia bovistercoris]MBH0777110.1 FKBP-type peptidyl-prolyl cis-trans isomerase [Nocardia bovistercoris]